jgi:hypothetical protein
VGNAKPRPRRLKRAAAIFLESPVFRALRALEGVRRTGIALQPFLDELTKRGVIGFAGDGQRVFWSKDAAKLILEIAAQVEEREAAAVAKANGNGARHA